MSTVPLFTQDQRSPNPQDHVNDRIYSALKELRAHLICRITKINKTGTAVVSVDCQPVMSDAVNNSGTLTMEEYPVLPDVPVSAYRGGGFSVTLPLKIGDIGMVHFHDLCIDTWWQNGGAATQIPWERRVHDLNDGVFYPSPQSCDIALQNYSLNSLQIRSDDGQTVIDVANGVVTIKAQAVNVQAQNATVQAQQTAQVSGQSVKVAGAQSVDIEGSGHTTIDGKPFLLHTHILGTGVTGPVA